MRDQNFEGDDNSSCIRSRGDIKRLRRNMPKSAAIDPDLVMLREGKGKPECKKSSTDILESKRPIPKAEICKSSCKMLRGKGEDPKYKKSGTGIEASTCEILDAGNINPNQERLFGGRDKPG